MLLSLLFIAMLFACVACFYNQGLWSAALAAVNVLLSAIVATNFFEPLAGLIGKSNYGDFLALWILFAATAALLRWLCDWLSPDMLRFDRWFDMLGAVAGSLAMGWILICFTAFTLHASPLPRTAFGDGFMATPDARHFNVGPDRLWLAFAHRQSQSNLSHATPQPFDPQADFILKHAHRRHPPKK